MASLPFIPLTPREQRAIGSLNKWMLFAAIAHLLGGLGACGAGAAYLQGIDVALEHSPPWAYASAVEWLAVVAIGLVMELECVVALLARSSLSAISRRGHHDQALLETSVARLSMFFVLELVVLMLFILTSLAPAIYYLGV